jgi:hypothetical protein
MMNQPRHRATLQPRHRSKLQPTTPGISRRALLGAGGLTAATLGAAPAVAPAFAATTTTTRPFVPYTSGSYFQSPIVGSGGTSRTLVSGTAVDITRTAAFRQFMRSHPDQKSYAYPRIAGTGSNRWGTAFAIGKANDPIWKLTGTVPPKCATLVTTGFHAPDWLGSLLTGTSDSPFCVVDLGSGFTVFGSKASVIGPRTISVSSAGITYHSSNGLHYKDPLSNDPRNFTSRGRLSDAMVIRSDLVDYGIANNTDLGHVLHLFLCETKSSDGFRHPMVACESGKYGFGAEGERIVIGPAIDLTTRGLTPAGLVIARTLQRHGCYFGDNAGRESMLKAEQENSAHPVWNGRLTMDSLAGLRWDDFVVLRP